jgi:O-glycosyl hydrolase
MPNRAITLPSLVAAMILSVASAVPAAAEFTAVTSRNAFESLIDGRELRRFGIRLTVTSEGQIVGRAFGGNVSGAWTWDNGYFCRDLFYGNDDLGYNCQLVQVHGDTLRFTTDRGEGIYADLNLR